MLVQHNREVAAAVAVLVLLVQMVLLAQAEEMAALVQPHQ